MKIKIGIGLHTTENVPALTYFSHLTELLSWSRSMPDVSFGFAGVSNLKVALARERIVTVLNENECDYWLSLDSDHILHPNLLPLLWESRDAAMVSGLIHRRIWPHSTVAFKNYDGKLQEIHLRPNTGVHEVDACAFGCTLVNLKLLRELQAPYFRDNERGRSDLNLCRAFREAGHSLRVDTRVTVGHLLPPAVIWPEAVDDYRAAKLTGDPAHLESEIS